MKYLKLMVLAIVMTFAYGSFDSAQAQVVAVVAEERRGDVGIGVGPQQRGQQSPALLGRSVVTIAVEGMLHLKTALGALPDELKTIYRTAWELPMKALIEMAAARGAYIDQSQSLNLFIASPNIGQLSSMYMYAWKCGLKTTYYLRSRPATRIAKTTLTDQQLPTQTGGDAVTCSLENPESCEACQ